MQVAADKKKMKSLVAHSFTLKTQINPPKLQNDIPLSCSQEVKLLTDVTVLMLRSASPFFHFSFLHSLLFSFIFLCLSLLMACSQVSHWGACWWHHPPHYQQRPWSKAASKPEFFLSHSTTLSTVIKQGSSHRLKVKIMICAWRDYSLHAEHIMEHCFHEEVRV